jgi:hypothetical protein
MHCVVEIFEEERERGAEGKCQDERKNNCAQSRWAHREIRRDSIIDDRDVVRPAS